MENNYTMDITGIFMASLGACLVLLLLMLLPIVTSVLLGVIYFKLKQKIDLLRGKRGKDAPSI